MLSRNLFQRRDRDADEDGDAEPAQNDGHRQPVDDPRYTWSRGRLGLQLLGTHVAVNTQ